jgi:hypothetical protein
MADDKVSFHVRVSPAVAAKIEDLATRLGWSQSRMAAELLEQGVEDSELVIKVIASVRDALGQFAETLTRKKRKSAQ